MNNNPISFTNLDRAERLSSATETTYDLIVIGGGITGAGIALDASLRGLKVILIEKNDFASGTSSKSTKLVHGGLRYLKQLELGLVRETGTERAIAHDNACHLVHPEDMLLPIVENGTFSSFSASIAISVYDRLAGVEPEQRRKKISKQDTAKLEPLLRKDILKSSILYSEYRSDDARLTIELIKAAKRNSAEAFNYLEVKDFVYQDGKVTGINCYDYATSSSYQFSADTIVSAAGPWVDKLRLADNASTETNLQLSKGSHIVLDKKLLNLNNSIYFDAFDGRMIFAIPRGNAVYVGTTDTFYYDDQDAVTCDRAEAEYLLKAIMNMFEVPPLTINDIQSTWSGLRPLIKTKGKSATELSRKDEIFISDSGLISIAGGKLTGFRKMAERIVDLVFKRADRKHVSCKTKTYKIHSNPFADYRDYKNGIKELITRYPGRNESELVYLTTTYGKDANKIIENADILYQGNLIKSQVNYTIQHESVFLPIDFIERRTGWLFFDIDQAKMYLSDIVSCFADAFSHNQEWIESNTKMCKEIIDTNSLKNLKTTS